MLQVSKDKGLALILGLACVFATSCTQKPAVSLPTDIVGISIGMPKAEAVKVLTAIGTLEAEAEKKQELWKLNDDPRFAQLAISYDGNDHVRFVSAFPHSEGDRSRLRFSEVGDLASAKAEIMPPHHRYIWTVDGKEGRPAYVVDVYGDNAEYVTQYSIANKFQSSKIKEYPQ
jgi:hypothetical protein